MKFLILIVFLFFNLLNSLSAVDEYKLSVETDKVYFSPNYDDLLDTFVFKIVWPNDRKVANWKLTIIDESGKLVKVFSSDLRHKEKGGIFNSLFGNAKELAKREIILPEQIEWIGNDLNGKILQDGRYIHSLVVNLENGKEVRSKQRFFYIDSIAPFVKLGSENRYLTPNNDKQFDTITIKQDIAADPSDRWFGSILNSKNEPIRTFQWDSKTLPKLLVWDGRDDRGILQDSGFFSYQLSGWDFAENKYTAELKDLYLNRDNLNLDAQADLVEFSPNGDGVNDSVFFKFFSAEKQVNNWEFVIFKNKGQTDIIYKTFKGTGVLPEFLEWDGKNYNNKTLSDGEYLYRLNITTNSKISYSISRKISLNKDAIRINFKITPDHFTPDGDGENDSIEIFSQIENVLIKTWKLTLIQNYKVENKKERQVIKKWKGIGMLPGRILWDGISDSGVLIGSLSDLELYFSFRDELDRTKIFRVKGFNTGILVTNTSEKLRVSIPEFILKENEKSILGDLKSIIASYPGYKVEIQSHSKQLGDNDKNMKKTELRVKSIFKKMFGKELDFDRFTYRGYGESDPLFYETDDYRQERNDRLDIILTRP